MAFRHQHSFLILVKNSRPICSYLRRIFYLRIASYRYSISRPVTAVCCSDDKLKALQEWLKTHRRPSSKSQLPSRRKLRHYGGYQLSTSVRVPPKFGEINSCRWT